MSSQPYLAPWERQKRLPAPAKLVSNKTGKTEKGTTPYQLGRRFEGAIRGRLERREWFVIRSYKSKGKADLLAVGKDRPALMVQCKRTSPPGSTEWNELYHLAQRYGAWPVIAIKLSERTVGFYRIDAPREPRKRGYPWTLFDPQDCREMLPPPTLLDKAA